MRRASYQPSINRDVRYVAFTSEASNITRDSGRRHAQVFVHDLSSGTTGLVNRTQDGRPGNGPSAHPSVSHDGSVVTFQSTASDLLCDKRCEANRRDINLVEDVYVRNRVTGQTMRASRDDTGREWMEPSRAPVLDPTGRCVAFRSRRPAATDDTAAWYLIVTSVQPSDASNDGSVCNRLHRP